MKGEVLHCLTTISKRRVRIFFVQSLIAGIRFGFHLGSFEFEFAQSIFSNIIKICEDMHSLADEKAFLIDMLQRVWPTCEVMS